MWSVSLQRHLKGAQIPKILSEAYINSEYFRKFLNKEMGIVIKPTSRCLELDGE